MTKTLITASSVWPVLRPKAMPSTSKKKGKTT